MPRKLNSRCPIAVRFAATFPLMDASNGVMVVPIFDPSIRAHASGKSIQPFEHIINVMVNVAADDWIIIVTTIPTRRNMSTEPNPIDE